jgi:hypothetical protein
MSDCARGVEGYGPVVWVAHWWSGVPLRQLDDAVSHCGVCVMDAEWRESVWGCEWS